MASIPPQSPPPPSGKPPIPPPPYGQPYAGQQPYMGDPRHYWRYQREQQRAAWRAQKQMLRSQRRFYRAPSIAGPFVLIAVGVVALLLVTGRLASAQFWAWYGHWWPVLLIGLGLVALAEWAIDLRRGMPTGRRFGGYVGLVILLLILGATATGFEHFWGPLQAQFGDNNDDFFSNFGQAQHDHDMEAVEATVPATAQIEIQNPRGDISVAVGDANQVSVLSHATVFGGTDDEANKIFAAQKPHLTVSGSAVVIKMEGPGNLRSNLTITVPRSATVNINNGHGDVTVAGISGNVDAVVEHGDFQATSVGGHVVARLASKGNFSAHDVSGDVTAQGVGDDVTISDIRGKLLLDGEYAGDIHLERVNGEIHFHSSRTDMELARLPGDLSMDLDSLHATQMVGPIRLVTRSKDIELSQVYGQSYVEDSDGRVELDMAGSYPVEVKNNKGDIEIAVPAGANLQVNGRTHNGDIVSDFPLTISGDDNKTITGAIGKGGPQLTLTNENADLRLRKGSSAPPAPPPVSAAPPPNAPAIPNAPLPPGVPRLKASKGQSAVSITQ